MYAKPPWGVICKAILSFCTKARGGPPCSPLPQHFNGEIPVKTENGDLDAEMGIECIQSLCLSEKSTECICPKCGARHRVKLLWTGRGIPRKFCPICKHYSNSINDADPCNVSPLSV